MTTTLHVIGSDESRAWTDWSGRGFRKKSLAEALKKACPSLRLTDRKRIAKKLADGEPAQLLIEEMSAAKRLFDILEATGVVFDLVKDGSNSLPKLLCEQCTKDEATVHITSIVEHEGAAVLNLCEPCAASHPKARPFLKTLNSMPAPPVVRGF